MPESDRLTEATGTDERVVVKYVSLAETMKWKGDTGKTLEGDD